MTYIQKEIEKQPVVPYGSTEVVVAQRHGTTFFATKPPENKAYRHTPEKDEFFMQLSDCYDY